MDGPQGYPMPHYIRGVLAQPFLKKDVPPNHRDFTQTRLLAAQTLNCRPEHIEILPLLIAPECPTAIMYSNWLRALPQELAAEALPIMLMAPSVYAKHLGYAQTEVGTASACVDFALEFAQYGHPCQMSLVTSHRTDIRPIKVLPVQPPSGTSTTSNQA